MKLATVVDFGDDVLLAKAGYTAETVDALIAGLKDYGVSRIYVQYYGNREHRWTFDTEAPDYAKLTENARHLPNYSRAFVESAKRHGMESAAVMRPQEQGIWTVYSPYYTGETTTGIPHLGGELLATTAFLQEHPELRIKRRSWDIDPDAASRVIGSIKLYKQNAVPTRIRKEDITIYTSPDNAYYKPYTGTFTLSYGTEAAKEDVVLSKTVPDYDTELLTQKGAPIQTITIDGLHITDRFVAIGVHCQGECDGDTHFRNTPVNGIACFTPEGEEICATPGGTRRPNPLGIPHLEAGFNFDDGFGAYQALTLDPDDGEGFLAIAKGKTSMSTAHYASANRLSGNIGCLFWSWLWRTVMTLSETESKTMPAMWMNHLHTDITTASRKNISVGTGNARNRRWSFPKLRKFGGMRIPSCSWKRPSVYAQKAKKSI